MTSNLSQANEKKHLVDSICPSLKYFLTVARFPSSSSLSQESNPARLQLIGSITKPLSLSLSQTESSSLNKKRKKPLLHSSSYESEKRSNNNNSHSSNPNSPDTGSSGSTGPSASSSTGSQKYKFVRRGTSPSHFLFAMASNDNKNMNIQHVGPEYTYYLPSRQRMDLLFHSVQQFYYSKQTILSGLKESGISLNNLTGPGSGQITLVDDKNSYNSLERLLTPLYVPSTIEEWTLLQVALFSCCICKFGKNFHRFNKIIKDKSTSQCVEYYYNVFKQSKHYQLWRKGNNFFNLNIAANNDKNILNFFNFQLENNNNNNINNKNNNAMTESNPSLLEEKKKPTPNGQGPNADLYEGVDPHAMEFGSFENNNNDLNNNDNSNINGSGLYVDSSIMSTLSLLPDQLQLINHNHNHSLHNNNSKVNDNNRTNPQINSFQNKDLELERRPGPGSGLGPGPAPYSSTSKEQGAGGIGAGIAVGVEELEADDLDIETDL